MRRLTTILSAASLALVLLGPAAVGVSAATVSYLGFPCDPNGTSGGSPTTTLSIVNLDTTTPSRSLLTCLFRGTRLPASFGGACSFDNAAVHVDFSRRTLLPVNNNTNLLCSGATVTLKTDLAINKTDGVTTAVIGGSTTYTIVVTNNGPSAVTGATVSDTFPAAITSDSWTAVGSGGASGFTASGSGTIADTVNLPVGATITYTVVATISPSASGSLSNTATVTAPAGVTDTNPGNNSATDTDTLVIGRTLTTTVSNFNGRDDRLFDLISYGTSQCTNHLEDGNEACTATFADGTVVTVDLQDESFFTFTCPGASEQNATGAGPYTGQCIVTMDANKQVSVIGDAIAP